MASSHEINKIKRIFRTFLLENEKVICYNVKVNFKLGSYNAKSVFR